MLDGRLLEHTLATCLAIGTAQDDLASAWAFLGPVQRVYELAGTVEADVQRSGTQARPEPGGGCRWSR